MGGLSGSGVGRFERIGKTAKVPFDRSGRTQNTSFRPRFPLPNFVHSFMLVEPFVGSCGELPIDYKFFVFGGQVAYIQVHLERETAHRWIVLDREWRQLTVTKEAPPPPNSLPAMICAAEALGRNFDFVRVDFYEVAGQPKFGEMTFYPGSGVYPLNPANPDVEMGALWLSAATRRGG